MGDVRARGIMKYDNNRIRELIAQLYAIVRELQQMFPDRLFTPDGHLVGSLGEVIAARDYSLTLLPSSTETHDARQNDRLVQIKITQGKRVALYSEPEYLLVLKLEKDGTSSEVFNGPGNLAWINTSAKQKNGQRPISLAKLRKLMLQVQPAQRIRKK